MMARCRMVLLAAALAACAAGAAEVRRSFEAVPKQALVELKATVGRPFSSGLVFLDGKFIPPPYKVERYGTAIRINGQQVTGQIIPWDDFLKTQAGVRVERVETPASETPAVVEEAAPAETSYSDDLSDDFDDLFDDNPKPKKKTSRPAARKPAAPPPPAAKVIFDGEFKPNTKSKAMVAKLNKIRTDLEVFLRKGGACFFGTRYSTVTADRAPADMFLEAIPRVMKDSTTFEVFSSAARSRGISYLSEPVLRDLFRNRLDYIKLQERAKAVKDERKWEAMLNKTGQ